MENRHINLHIFVSLQIQYAPMNNLTLTLYITPIVSCIIAFSLLVFHRRSTLSQVYLAVFFFILGALLTAGLVSQLYLDRIQREFLTPFFSITSIACALLVLFYFVALMQPKRLTWSYVRIFVALLVLYALIMIAPGIRQFIRGVSAPGEQLFGYHIFAVLCNISIEAYTVTMVVRMYLRLKRDNPTIHSCDFRWIWWSNAILVVFALQDIVWKLIGNIDLSPYFNFSSLIFIWIVFILGFRHREVSYIKQVVN